MGRDISGLAQGQQRGFEEYKLSDKIRLALQEMAERTVTRAELANVVYTRGSCTPSKDNDRVCRPIPFTYKI